MRLYLAVAMLMLAFVAYTEAQDAELTVKERFSQFGQTMADVWYTMQNNEFAKKTNDWLTEQLNRIKDKAEELSQ